MGFAMDAAQVASEQFGTSEWLTFFGKLHPLALHMPIGLLAGVVVVECVSGVRPSATVARRWMYAAFAVSAVVAASTGWLLGNGEEYRSAVVDEHRTFGIAAAVVAVVASACAVFGRSSLAGGLRLLGLVACTVLFTVAGHRGGMMTHGTRFLAESAPPWLAPYVGPPERVKSARPLEAQPPENLSAEALPVEVESPPLATVVAAFEARCIECHDEQKTKGKLRLDLVEGWLSQVDQENPLDSELLYRVKLPADDPDAMPPEGARLDAAAIDEIQRWLEAGALEAELQSAFKARGK